ncbi:MAG: hypothetical protein ACLVAV_13050 [Clostridium sp.]
MAENEVAAAQAARLIKVEYEEYEPIVTVEAAIEAGGNTSSSGSQKGQRDRSLPYDHGIF